MDQEARALIERLRDDTQDREVFDRCNAVLAAPSPLRFPSGVYIVGEPWPARKVTSISDFIHATEAEVEIITGERDGDQ